MTGWLITGILCLPRRNKGTWLHGINLISWYCCSKAECFQMLSKNTNKSWFRKCLLSSFASCVVLVQPVSWFPYISWGWYHVPQKISRSKGNYLAKSWKPGSSLFIKLAALGNLRCFWYDSPSSSSSPPSISLFPPRFKITKSSVIPLTYRTFCHGLRKEFGGTWKIDTWLCLVSSQLRNMFRNSFLTKKL